MAWKSSWWIILQYFYIEYETRGGVDVIPCVSTLEKSKIRDFVLKLEKTRFFSVTNLCISGKPRTWRGLKNRKFFFWNPLCKIASSEKRFQKVGRFFRKSTKIDPNFPEFPGKFPPEIFRRRNFPEFSRNFLPKFPEISWILTFLKDKIRAVALMSSPENTGKSGGKFPEISPGKIPRRFLEFHKIGKFPGITWNHSEDLTRTKYVHNIKSTILGLYDAITRKSSWKYVEVFIIAP